MGAYVNHPKLQKEDWLLLHANAFGPNPPQWRNVPEGYLPVCLVDNGPFTAAGIAFSEDELEQFSEPSDSRPKTWYLAPIARLKTVSDVEKYLNE
jgi:hypothetical protein